MAISALCMWYSVGTKWFVRQICQVYNYLQYDLFTAICTKYSQRRAHSRNIGVDEVLQRVLSRRSQWNVLLNTSIHVDSRDTFCRLLGSNGNTRLIFLTCGLITADVLTIRVL